MIMNEVPMSVQSLAFTTLVLLLLLVTGLPACSRDAEKKHTPPEFVQPAPLEGDGTAFQMVGIELVRPPGFERAKDFSGFIQKDSGAEIRALAPPLPYEAVKAAFGRKAAPPKGMTIESRTTVEVDGRPSLLLRAKQKRPDGDAVDEAWVAVGGTEAESRVVTATWPPSKNEELSALLRRAVVSWKLIPVSDPARQITFHVTPSGELKQDPSVLKYQMLLYVTNPGAPQRPGEPAFVVSASRAKVAKNKYRSFAEESLESVKDFQIDGYTSHQPVTIDELEGYELVGDGTFGEDSLPVVAYHVVLLDSNERCYTMLGLVGEPKAKEYLPEFKKMARSFARDRSP